MSHSRWTYIPKIVNLYFSYKLYNVHLHKRELDNHDPMWQMGHSKLPCIPKLRKNRHLKFFMNCTMYILHLHKKRELNNLDPMWQMGHSMRINIPQQNSHLIFLVNCTMYTFIEERVK